MKTTKYLHTRHIPKISQFLVVTYIRIWHNTKYQIQKFQHSSYFVKSVDWKKREK